MNLVLQARPEIHGYRTDLNLYFRIHRAIRQVHRNTDDHVVAFVTACLGIGDVILHCDHPDILLIPDHIRDTIDIGSEGTDDTDASDIVYVFYHIVYGGFLSVTLQLFDNTLRSLDPRLDMFNRIILVYMLKFIVQDLHLRLHLTQCRTVYQRNLLPAVDSVPVLYFKLHITSQSSLSLHKNMIPHYSINIIIPYLLSKMYNFNKTFIIF